MVLALLESGTVFAQAKGANGGGAALGAMFYVLYFGLIVLYLVGMWKVYTKAGEPGWAAIIPIYNVWVLARIGGKPEWWGLLLFIPCVGIIFAIIICLGVAERFGQSTIFGIGLAILGFICFPVLGFGSAKYQGRNR